MAAVAALQWVKEYLGGQEIQARSRDDPLSKSDAKGRRVVGRRPRGLNGGADLKMCDVSGRGGKRKIPEGKR